MGVGLTGRMISVWLAAVLWPMSSVAWAQAVTPIPCRATAVIRDDSTPPSQTSYTAAFSCTVYAQGGATGSFPGAASTVLEFPGPPPDPLICAAGGAAGTEAVFIEAGQPITQYLDFYTADGRDELAGCAIETQHWALYGSIGGTVKLKDGTPVRDYPVLADDPQATPVVTWAKLTSTDATGTYSFDSKSARIYSWQYPGLVDFPIPESNHWGLRVFQAAPRTLPNKVYNVHAGTQAVAVTVTSSAKAVADFVLPLEEAEEEPPYLRCDAGGAGGDACLQDDSLNAACPGKPVSVLTGNVFFDHLDALVPGGVPLLLERHYNSVQAFRGRSGWFGVGWRSTWEREVDEPRPGVLRVRRANGNVLHFTDRAGDGTYRPYHALMGRGRFQRVAGEFVFTRRDGTRETYDGQGRLRQVSDTAGRTTVLERDGLGRVAAIVASNGRRLTLHYNGSGSTVQALFGPAGLLASYGYDDAGRLSRTTYPDGSGYEYSYDEHGQITQVRDLTGRVLESHTYAGGKGLTSELTDGIERLTFSYDATGTTVTDALGQVTRYELEGLDEFRVVARIVGPCSACGGAGGERHEWERDALGRVTAYKNALGQKWTYGYDAEGHRDVVTDPGGRSTRYTFDARGRVLTVLPPAGVAWTFTYGDAGPVSVTDPLGHAATATYTSSGALETLTDARGQTLMLTHNAFGDVTGVRDALGHRTTYMLDAMGRTTAIEDAAGRTTHVGYDAVGRLSSVRRATGQEWRVVYDAGGRQTSAQDPEGRETRYVYDAYGRLTLVRDPASGTTRLGYDVMSRLTSLTDAEGHTTRFERDAYGRLAAHVYPDGQRETYGHDAAGRLVTRTKRSGLVTTYEYDELGRVRREQDSDGSPARVASYDDRGRLVTLANGTDTLSWTYDEADRVLSETSARNGSTVGYAYDAGGLRSSLALEGVTFLSYGWDAGGRLETLQRGTRVFTFGHDVLDRRTSLTHANGLETTYAYDLADRLLSVTARQGVAVLSQAGYTYDRADNRLSKTASGFTESYGYDVLDRLVSVERGAGAAGHAHFGYDRVGNRLVSQVNDVVRQSTYDAGGRLLATAGGGPLVVQGQLDEPGTVTVNGTPARMLAGNVFEATIASVTGPNTVAVEARDLRGNVRSSTYALDMPPSSATYSYDLDGNLSQVVRDGHTWTYAWTSTGALQRVSKDGVELARFAYDPLGRRVEKVAAGVTRRYTYDGLDIVREVVVDGSTTSSYRYVHGPGVDEPVAREDATSGVFEFYHADGLGSVLMLSDQQGVPTQRSTYDAWGQLEQGAERGGYAFTGREWDPEIGLYYYRARYYDPQIGRFISEDPIGFAGGVNFYGYVGGNPVNRTDPLGLVDGGFLDQMNPFNLDGSLAHTGLSIWDSAAGMATGDWSRVTAAGATNPLGQTENGPRWAYYGTRSSLAISGAAATAAGYLIAVEGAAAHGFCAVGRTVTQRAMQPLGSSGHRWYSETLTRQLISNGPRSAPNAPGVANWLTLLRYGQRGSGEVTLNWVTRTIIHSNPFF